MGRSLTVKPIIELPRLGICRKKLLKESLLKVVEAIKFTGIIREELAGMNLVSNFDRKLI